MFARSRKGRRMSRNPSSRRRRAICSGVLRKYSSRRDLILRWATEEKAWLCAPSFTMVCTREDFVARAVGVELLNTHVALMVTHCTACSHRTLKTHGLVVRHTHRGRKERKRKRRTFLLFKQDRSATLFRECSEHSTKNRITIMQQGPVPH